MISGGSSRRASYSDAEQQVLAILGALEANPIDHEKGRPATFDQDCLRRHGRLFFQDDLLDWSGVFERLLSHGHLRRQGTGLHLTNRSRDAAERFRKRFTGDRMGRLQVRCEASAAYQELSRRVFLGNICPFSLLDRLQLDAVQELLQAAPDHLVLDLGCGIGTVTEALHRTTGARFVGFDLAEPAILRAQERARDQGISEDRLHFRQVDLETLSPTLEIEPWDRLLAIDVLYFLKDPAATLSRFLPSARPGARMVLVTSDLASGPESVLDGRETRLGKILTDLHLPFEAQNVSHLEEDIWRRQEKAARDLLDAFRNEGSEDLGRLFLQEAERCLPWVEEGRARRFLYKVDLP